MKKLISLILISLAFIIGAQTLDAQIRDSVAYNRKMNSSYLEAYTQQILGNTETAITKYEDHLDKYATDDAAFYQLARIYSQEGQYGLAAEYARRATALNPEQDWYQLLYADILKNNGQVEQATQIMEQLVAKRPENIEYTERLALAYALLGQYEKSLKYYQILEDKTDITEELSIQKHKLWLLLGNQQKANEEIVQLTKRYPAEPKYYSMLAEIYLKEGEKEKALAAYQKVKEINPDDPYIHISMADFFMNNQEYDNAFKELKAGFAVPSLNIDSKIQILLTYFSTLSQQADFQEKLVDLSDILVKAHPEDPKAYSVYGDMLNQMDRKKEARDAYEKVIELDSSRYFIWEQLLFIYNSLQQNEKLNNYSARANELFPLQPIPYLFRGISAFIQKDYQQAADALSIGVQYVYDNDALKEQFYIFLGDTYNELGDTEKSYKTYDKVLMINPKNAYVMNNYSYHLAEAGQQLNKALQMAKLANEIEKDNPSYMDTYGWAFYKLAQYKDAAKWVKKALAKDENNGVLLEHYGDIMYKLGNTQKALKYWKKALENGAHSELLEKKIEDKKLYE